MSRYRLSKKIRKILEARGYELICKICGTLIDVGELVESKQQRRGKCKLYHAVCYDNSMLDIPDDYSDSDEEVDKFFKRPTRILTEKEAIRWVKLYS